MEPPIPNELIATTTTSVAPTTSPSPEFNPLAPDAPIAHLLSISSNPQVKNLSDQQLMDLVKRVKTLAISPQTLSSKLSSESRGRRTKVLTPEQLKRKSIIDSL